MVVAIKKPEFVVLEGRFGLPISGTVALTLTSEVMETTFTVTHQSMGNCPIETTMRYLAAWEDFCKRLKSMAEVCTAVVRQSPRDQSIWSNVSHIDDAAALLEHAYQELQSNLIQVRQATAQAIAAEKVLEQQLQKNIDQAETWRNRAAMATQQNNEDLSNQASQRQEQYVEAANEIEIQLREQKATTSTLRQRLTALEREVQAAYTKKQVLIARDRVASAREKVDELLAHGTEDTKGILERLEERITERELRSKDNDSTPDKDPLTNGEDAVT